MTALLAAGLAEVTPANLAGLSLSDFRDDELGVPFYLAHFAQVANSIEENGPNRGFITLPVWRPKEHNKPYNARVLENYVVLAYFYCTQRPWNPYYADAAVRQRLEALLDFWCRAQHTDGRFSEYRPEGWNLPATGFATMFMGETLRLLDGGPPVDSALHKRVVAAHHKAMRALLTNQALFDGGRSYSNQYSGLWGGMLAHVELYPDAELEALLRERLEASLREHQSPAGYWYEAGGCDWAYTLRTHAGNLLMAWHYACGTDLADAFVQAQSRWAEWMSYNTVFEPDSSTCVLNRAIETRTRGLFRRRHDPLAEQVPLLRAFIPTQQEVDQAIERKRRELEENWPDVPDLEIGHHHAYSPHVILNLGHRRWYPTDSQRAAAVAQMPCLAKERFNHLRVDNSRPQAHAFIRRPAYYAVFNAGQKLTGQQRFGLGLLWTERHGALLQSQSASRQEAWGTRAAGADNVFETDLRGATLAVNGKQVAFEPGARDVPDGPLVIAYSLQNEGRKTVQFSDRVIRVEIEHPGEFTEQLPLLVAPEWSLDVREASAELTHGQPILNLRFEMAQDARAVETDTAVAGKRLVVLVLRAVDRLTYEAAPNSGTQQ